MSTRGEMKVTFVVKNIAPSMHDRLAAMPDSEKFAQLRKWATGDLKHCVTQKTGNGSFRDRVAFNDKIRNGAPVKNYTLDPRRGYMLATFIF